MLYFIICGLLVALLIIIAWFGWAYFVYRTSDDRIKSKIAYKFNGTSEKITEAESKLFYLEVTNLVVKENTVSATVILAPLPGITDKPTRGPFEIVYNLKDLGL